MLHLPSLAAVLHVWHGEEEAEKWRNGAGENLERQEATGTGRLYG